MLATAISAVLLFLPQTQGGPGKPASDPKPRVIGVTENGWPIFAEEQDPERASGAGRSDFETKPRPLRGQGPVSSEETSVGERAKQAAENDPMRLGSPLRAVFSSLGYPSDMRELGAVMATCRISLRNHNGAEIGRRDLEHLADFERKDRDLLRMFPGMKTYGRDGAAVFASIDRVPMASYREEASDELQLFGLLLRFPWCFADAERFVVEDEETLTIAGQAMVRIPIRALEPRDDSSLNGQVDRFEILCAADSMEPKELQYTLAGSNMSRRLRLGEYTRTGGVRIPFRREFLTAAGAPSLILEILELEIGREVSAEDFRPLQ